MFARFEKLCDSFDTTMAKRDSSGIGTYNEKLLHKALKHAICEDGGCLEVGVGAYVADVLLDGEIFEIQTGGFYPLAKKIEYLLENTEYNITVVHPIISELLLVRVDDGTGEIVRKKRSPKKEKPCDIFSEMYYLKKLVLSERVRIWLPHISGVEYRFSERVRGRKSGAYDSVFFPERITGFTQISTPKEVFACLPSELRAAECFDSATFAKAMRLRGKRASLSLKFLCDIGLLTREKDGRRYLYYIANQGF